MKKAAALKFLNPVLGILGLWQALTGIFAQYILENLPSDFFKYGHGFMGFVLTAVAVTHLTLNWSWVKTTYLKKRAPAAPH
jgi:hypothetical protein